MPTLRFLLRNIKFDSPEVHSAVNESFEDVKTRHCKECGTTLGPANIDPNHHIAEDRPGHDAHYCARHCPTCGKDNDNDFSGSIQG